MNRPPDFDELVGFDVEAGERERLRRVHGLLVQAGPPAELPPELEAGPTLAMTLGRPHGARRFSRRMMLLAAAIVVLALAFLGGYLAGNRQHGLAAAKTMNLVGTKPAPAAFASLQIMPVDAAGNWPMRITVTGLPKLPPHTYYEVYLMRRGRPYAACGTFVVSGTNGATRVELSAPYGLKHGDTWVVTKQGPGQREPGEVMLEPVT
ncbi:MAG TPA: hypothetical protein VE261_00935 [Gaiellaceae bacterium]|nr:hypothetical protein [Gaiellaceae bacterium]